MRLVNFPGCFVLVVLAALVVGCQPAQPESSSRRSQAGIGKRQGAKRPASESRGTFFARGTGGDRRALVLKKLAVSVTTQPGTVRSHLVMEVASPGEGQAEAVMRLAVPHGAAVTNAVLWVNDKPMRGAFVERQRANDIYTSIVTRRRDPALVSWDGPGWIAVSIFPLERNQPRRFELEWVEPAALADGRVQYRMPMVTDGERVIGRAALEVDGRQQATGGRDLVAIAPANEHRVIARRVPGDPFQQVLVRDASPTGVPHFVLVVETSAAMTGPDRTRQRAVIDAVLGELPAGSKLTMLAADWNASVIVEEADASRWPGALAKIDGIASAGALHLERGLREAAARARKTQAGAVLFVGHGEDGFGGDALAAPLADLRGGRIRLSAVRVGSGDVPRPLAAATVETGGMAMSAVAFAESIASLVDALRPRPDNAALDADGAGEWHTLRTVIGETVWIGRALEGSGSLDANTARADSTSTLAADLASLWDRARLEWRDRDAADGVASVLTPVTSLLVLETEQDYQRFGLSVPGPVAIDRAVSGETMAAVAQPQSSDIASVFGRDSALGADATSVLGDLAGPQTGAASGVGGLGILGTLGTGSAGSGYGAGIRRARAPDVKPGQLIVRGSLDKEIVRRIVRRHINEVKYCYSKELARGSSRSGRVVAQFTVAPAGNVLASVLQSSTLGSPVVEACIVQAIKRWEFPKPYGGGIVVVSYLFDLRPGHWLPETAGVRRMAPEPPAPPAPPTPIEEALATLAGGADAERIQRISSLLGLRRTPSAEVLAWTIDRRAGGLETKLLVARLLALTKHHDDAVRVLSEAARNNSYTIAAELRRIGADADADEVLALVKR